MISIRTPRLLIREYTVEDLPQLHAILSDSATMSFWPAPFTIEQSESWMRRSLDNYKEGYGRMAVVLQDRNEMIGDVGIQPLEIDGREENDLGYIIHSNYWGNGYGYEAAQAVMAHGWNALQLERICASMSVEHVRSRKLAEKLGMVLEKEFSNKRNRNLPTYLFASNR